MKKLFSVLAIGAAVAMSLAFTNDSNNVVNDENRAIAVAKNALVTSCSNTQGNLQASVSENYNCNIFDGVGINRTVTFYRTPNCPPNQICIQVIEVVGQVVVDCDFSVASVSCGTASTF